MTTKAVFAPDDEVSFLYREKHRCRGIVLSSHAQGYVILKCTSGYAEGRTLAVNFPALKRIDPEPASANLAGPRQSDIRRRRPAPADDREHRADHPEHAGLRRRS